MQHALHRRHRAPTRNQRVLLRMEEGSRGARAIMVVSGSNAAIQRHGVFPVNARGLPTATQGLTHFLKLDGNQQQGIAGMADNHQMNNLTCLR